MTFGISIILFCLFNEMIGIIRLVGKQSIRVKTLNEIMGLRNVITLARGSDQLERHAERIGCRVDFGAQSAARAAKALGIRPPFLRRAPAAC